MGARAAQHWRWEGSNDCTGEKSLLNVDEMNQCTPYHFPAPASVLVVRKNNTAYSSYHYGPGGEPGTTDCSGARSLIADFAIGKCVGFGNYSQVRVWIANGVAPFIV